MGKGSARRRGKGKTKAGLSSGGGSGLSLDLSASDGFERVTVTDEAGALATPQRRTDNLLRLIGPLGEERVNALIFLRMASEAAAHGISPRCNLAQGPSGGPDAFLHLIQSRIDATRWAGLMWGAVGGEAEADVRRVVLQGMPIQAAAACYRVRADKGKALVKERLAGAADRINRMLDQRYGATRMRWSWDAQETRGEVRKAANCGPEQDAA
jgi:hypothetical protein